MICNLSRSEHVKLRGKSTGDSEKNFSLDKKLEPNTYFPQSQGKPNLRWQANGESQQGASKAMGLDVRQKGEPRQERVALKLKGCGLNLRHTRLKSTGQLQFQLLVVL